MPLLGGARRAQSMNPSSSGRLKNMSRSKSAPARPSTRHIKGIMKFTSVEASLHSTYGSGCSGSNSDNNSESKDGDGNNNRRIVFKEILVREYARTVGDNPSCSSGPPVTIAWDYDPETKIISIDQYEELRPPRRTHFEMILPRAVRQSMLRKEWDVTQNQIAAAVRANIKAKNQRRSTINNLGKATKMEELFESAGRKVKRGLMFKKSVSKQVEELEEQMSILNCVRSQHDLEIMMKDEYEDDVVVEEEDQEGVGGDNSCDNSHPADRNQYDSAAAKSSPPTHQRIKIEEESSSSDDDEGGEEEYGNKNNDDVEVSSSNPNAAPTTEAIPAAAAAPLSPTKTKAGVTTVTTEDVTSSSEELMEF